MEIWLRIIGIVCVLCVLYWCMFAGGPVRLYRRYRGRTRAQEGSQRRTLVERVQALLPQASEETVLFSMEEKHSTSGGSQLTIMTTTYIPRVFVIDGERLWVIPVAVGKRHQYQLGEPVPITSRSIKRVSLQGTAGKREQYTFYVETQSGMVEVDMVVQPFVYQKNRYCPVDLVQEKACKQAVAMAQRMALLSCDMSVYDLEEDRQSNQGLRYATYAGCLGMLGVLSTPAETIAGVVFFFAAALVMFGLMLVNHRIPKFSALVVLVEAIVAYQLIKG